MSPGTLTSIVTALATEEMIRRFGVVPLSGPGPAPMGGDFWRNTEQALLKATHRSTTLAYGEWAEAPKEESDGRLR